ncbi:DUF262 domain-containing protein [Plantactinospora sp. S1510]|uniref:DUF262 domain-containing protein n=1 Tax=Plantactinospora alkalitolerans TaxID=2789879 RepID=A0ABS0HAQ1_9ACTN|nr:DUF262 domain-containing protein [Plantactinospora alkalitolerans]MBF9135177.1 DUF262 domain-containing protein [Plantactinospora alkalitolerans]
MTRQTPAPLERLPINASSIPLTTLVAYVESGRIDLNPPYQRGDVWGTDQRVGLVYSWLRGATVPSITINDRSSDVWADVETYDIGATDEGIWAVIDGRQRLTTAAMWMRGEFAVPASWFPAEMVETAEDTDDGPYVRHTGLTPLGQNRGTNRTIMPVGIGEFASLQAEAEIFLLLNGNGTPQTGADMARATRVAEGRKL